MSWSHDEVRLLIQSYKQHPCLYAIKNPKYKNKHARASALEIVRETLAELRPSVNILEIKNKFNNLRTNFMAERRKHVASQRSGAGTIEIYKPSLWYYDDISFVTEHIVPRVAVDSISSADIDLDHLYHSQDESVYETDLLGAFDENPQNVEMFYEGDDGHEITNDSVNSQTETLAQKRPLNVGEEKSKKKRKADKDNDAKTEEVMQSASSALNQITTMMTRYSGQTNKETQSDIFASFIATQLKLLESDQNLYLETQQQITNIMFNARQQLLGKEAM